MFKVYYVYEKTERTREKTGFSCKRLEIREFVGEYPDTDAAKKHPPTLTEKEFPGGCYYITKEAMEEKKELPPKTPPKEVDKKKKKK